MDLTGSSPFTFVKTCRSVVPSARREIASAMAPRAQLYFRLVRTLNTSCLLAIRAGEMSLSIVRSHVLRQANEWDAVKPVSVMGPFNELEYRQEKTRLQLPELSIVFGDLK